MTKRKLLCLILFLCGRTPFPLSFAHGQNARALIEPLSQAVLPRNIYVGDKAEIRYSFNSTISLFRNANTRSQTQPIDLEKLKIAYETPEYSIENMMLEFNGNNYVLVLTLQPWVTGEINFPSFDLGMAISEISKPFVCMIILEPITILPLVSSGDNSLRGIGAPLLVPGTTYFFYGTIALIFILLLLFIVAAVRFHGIKVSLKNFMVQFKYRQNARRTFSRIKKLERQSPLIDDKKFCQELQEIMRSYISIRYGFSFSSVVTSKLMPTFFNLTGNTLSGKKEEAAQAVVDLFYRADHIKFAEGSDGYTPLADNERETLASSAKHIVAQFETKDASEDKTDV